MKQTQPMPRPEDFQTSSNPLPTYEIKQEMLELDQKFVKVYKAQLGISLGDQDLGEVTYHCTQQRQGVGVLVHNLDHDTIVLVGQYRYPLARLGRTELLWEIPAGLVDEGETTEQAAIREVQEEAGYRLSKVQCLGEVASAPGLFSNLLTLYLALVRDQDKVEKGGGLANENEYIAIADVPLKLLQAHPQMLSDSKSLAALCYYASFKDQSDKC